MNTAPLSHLFLDRCPFPARMDRHRRRSNATAAPSVPVRLCVSALLLFFAFSPVRADRNVKFKAKTYEPRKTFEAKPYEAKPYSPHGGAVRAAPYTPGRAGTWKMQGERQTAPARPFNGDAGTVPARTFTPGPAPSVKTFKSDPADVQERKPYVPKAPDPEHKAFTPPTKKDEYNPLLTPRQGIKEEHLNGK
ncbi:MAG: hypothetical protein J6Z49_04980 [Kiritimatiellae bacterium]|nr:hypothetical protein [Kiritimatiellia bacterium]